MSVALLWVMSPSSRLANGFGFIDSIREGNRLIDSRLMIRDRCSVFARRRIKDRKQKRFSYSVNVPEITSMVVSTADELATLSSEEKVYNVVLKQAALITEKLRSNPDIDVNPDAVLPGNLGLLSEAYDRCGEVCAEYAKTFYLGLSYLNICLIIDLNDFQVEMCKVRFAV